jgi:hypothetical protein
MKKIPHRDRKHIIPMIKFSPNVLKHSLKIFPWKKFPIWTENTAPLTSVPW